MHFVRSLNCSLRFYLSDAFSCDEAQKKADKTLPKGQYWLTNGNKSFKVGRMEETSLTNLTKAKQNFSARIVYDPSPPKMCNKY